MKRKLSFAAVIAFLLLLPIMCGSAIKLPDLRDIGGSWSEAYIVECTERGIAAGFDDGTFRPSEPVTRAQFIKMTVNAFAIPAEETDPAEPAAAVFADISGHWAEQYINAAYRAEIVFGTDGSHFNPDKALARQDAVLILSRVEKYLGKSLPETVEAGPFLDGEYIRAECADAVGHFRRAGVIVGKIGNLYDPIGDMTRAEAAKCIIFTIRGFETPVN